MLPSAHRRISESISRFRDKVFHHNAKLRDRYYGEWEIGTYHSAWRVIRDRNILCASNNIVDSFGELDRALQVIDFGRITALEHPNGFDVHAQFDTGISLHFLPVRNDPADEAFG